MLTTESEPEGRKAGAYTKKKVAIKLHGLPKTFVWVSIAVDRK